jgi:putative chitinase
MLLKRGDNNEQVKQLQSKLGIEVAGNFGPKTEEAVIKFQKLNGLNPDGIVGDDTWKKIMESKPNNNLNINKLKGHIPESVLQQIPDTTLKFNINSILRLAHFLSQAGHESGQFKSTQENLNYSSKGLIKIFPKYFPQTLAESYAHKPQNIANRVYGNRMGNGNEISGDGYKFRGRGYIQLTGKNNYTEFDKTVPEDIISNPDLVATLYPLQSAAWFFDKNKLWGICDKGADRDTVVDVTRKVNGGILGLQDRFKHFTEYYNLLK